MKFLKFAFLTILLTSLSSCDVISFPTIPTNSSSSSSQSQSSSSSLQSVSHSSFNIENSDYLVSCLDSYDASTSFLASLIKKDPTAPIYAFKTDYSKINSYTILSSNYGLAIKDKYKYDVDKNIYVPSGELTNLRFCKLVSYFKIDNSNIKVTEKEDNIPFGFGIVNSTMIINKEDTSLNSFFNEFSFSSIDELEWSDTNYYNSSDEKLPPLISSSNSDNGETTYFSKSIFNLKPVDYNSTYKAYSISGFKNFSSTEEELNISVITIYAFYKVEDRIIDVHNPSFLKYLKDYTLNNSSFTNVNKIDSNIEE